MLRGALSRRRKGGTCSSVSMAAKMAAAFPAFFSPQASSLRGGARGGAAGRILLPKKGGHTSHPPGAFKWGTLSPMRREDDGASGPAVESSGAGLG